MYSYHVMSTQDISMHHSCTYVHIYIHIHIYVYVYVCMYVRISCKVHIRHLDASLMYLCVHTLIKRYMCMTDIHLAAYLTAFART